MHYLKYILLLPFWVICGQLYFYSVSQKNEQRQRGCRSLGIFFLTIGIVSLVSRDYWFVISGLALIMLGLRLTAYGLDRIDKSIYIDRCEEDR
ncbi:MAG: hypothetical protein JJE30_09125 [Desulfuromonadales bacterium]|nr:hypothetical protein [Desulfuromonadales bacterium]